LYQLFNGPISAAFGTVWGIDGTVVEITASGLSQRSFTTPYAPEAHWLGSPIVTQFLDFKHTQVFVIEATIDFSCSEINIVVGQKGSMPGTFDITDDSRFTVNVTDDIYNSCASAVKDVSITFVKQ